MGYIRVCYVYGVLSIAPSNPERWIVNMNIHKKIHFMIWNESLERERVNEQASKQAGEQATEWAMGRVNVVIFVCASIVRNIAFFPFFYIYKIQKQQQQQQLRQVERKKMKKKTETLLQHYTNQQEMRQACTCASTNETSTVPCIALCIQWQQYRIHLRYILMCACVHCSSICACSTSGRAFIYSLWPVNVLF